MSSASNSVTSPATAPMTSERAPSKPRACMNCARSKTKCHWLTETTCQRCSRSNLHCAVPESRPRKTRGKSKRVGMLEKKVDRIMTILTARQQTAPVPDPPFIHTQQLQLPQTPHGETTAAFSVPLNNDVVPLSPSLTLGTIEEYIECPLGTRVSLLEADQILSEYRTNMEPSFPFVHIPPWTAREMSQAQPLLLKTVVNACRPRPGPATTGMDQWFREYFAHHVVVKEERSLELLQAILVFLAWHHWNFFVHACDTSLMQLALGLVGDMGLNRSPETQTIPSRLIMDETTLQVKGMNVRSEHSHAERRALLGVFYMSTCIRTIFRRTEPLEYTQYMEQCCSKLSEVNDCPTDQLAVALVRIQNLTLQTTKIIPRNINTEDIVLGVPHTMAFASIKKQLEDIISQLPENLKSNHLLRNHYYMVLIRLYEPLIEIKSVDPTNQSFTRSQALWTCCQSAKSLLELYISIPRDMFAAFSFIFIAHLSYSNLVLTHLLFLEDPDWDARTARESVDYPGLIQRLSDHFGAYEKHLVHRAGAPGDGKGVFSRCMERLRWARNWYLSKLCVDPMPADMMIAAPSVPDDLMYETWQILFA